MTRHLHWNEPCVIYVYSKCWLSPCLLFFFMCHFSVISSVTSISSYSSSQYIIGANSSLNSGNSYSLTFPICFQLHLLTLQIQNYNANNCRWDNHIHQTKDDVSQTVLHIHHPWVFHYANSVQSHKYLKRSSEDMYLLCNLNCLHISIP